MTIQVQFITLLWMVGSGILMGVVYDIYRVLQIKLRIGKKLIPLMDLIYWIGSALFVFYILFQANGGQLRLYIFLALAAGMWIYFRKWSSATIRLMLFLIQILVSVIQFAKKVLFYILVQPLLWVINIAAWIGYYGMKVVYLVLRTAFLLIKPIVILFKPLLLLYQKIEIPIRHRLNPIVKRLRTWYRNVLQWFKS